MQQIEAATGKKIIRIETDDLDAMEEVRLPFLRFCRRTKSIILSRLAANEEGAQVNGRWGRE